MAALNSKFDVLRGWAPGDDACVDQSLTPVTGTVFEAGDVVMLNGSGEATLGASAADVTPGTGLANQLYLVVEGNAIDFSGQFVNKVVCIRGKLTVQIDSTKYTGTTSVGTPVKVVGGAFESMLSTGLEQMVGHVFADNSLTNGTIVLEIDL